jgi:hypothetical protein
MPTIKLKSHVPVKIKLPIKITKIVRLYTKKLEIAYLVS